MFEWGGGRREYHDFLSKIFCLTVPKNFAGEPFSAVLQKFPVAKKFLDKGGGEVSGFSVENFLSHSAENFRRGIVYCCIDFGYRKSLWIIGEGEYQDFPSKFFCLTVPKNFAGEPFSAVLQKFPVAKKFMDKGGGGVSRFSVENFLSHSAEKFRCWNLLRCVSENFR